MNEPTPSGISRRTLAKGAAWAAPAAAVVAVAPSVAASPQLPGPGLQGWDRVQYGCSVDWDWGWEVTRTLDWDSGASGNFPLDPFINERLGLWVYHTQTSATPPYSTWTFSNVTLEFTLPAGFTGNITTATGNNGWSVARVGSSTVWRATYNGDWTHHSDPDGNPETYPVSYSKVNGRLHLRYTHTYDGSSCPTQPFNLTITRCVTIHRPNMADETICFSRTITMEN